MQNSLGVKSPGGSKLLVLGSPAGPYYPSGFKPISLACSNENIRSAPGGTGAYKVGGYINFNLEIMGQHQIQEIKRINKDIIKFYGFMEIK